MLSNIDTYCPILTDIGRHYQILLVTIQLFNLVKCGQVLLGHQMFSNIILAKLEVGTAQPQLVYLNIGHTRGRTRESGPQTRGRPMAFCFTSGISQLLMTQLYPNFKGRFLGTARTDSNGYSDICRCNISPGDICSDQDYLK